ncbi:MAG: type VII secretion protein EccB [Mycobacterium sp.]
MPLNLSNRDQSSGHLFYNRRLRAAITRFSVRMKHDDRKQQAALALATVFVLLGCGWMALLQVMKPAGLVGQSAIVGDRDTGALYARIDGRLHPALNLASARLATGSAAAPTWVTAREIAKHPTGPLIGIAGIPDSYSPASANSAWAVCDTARGSGGGDRPAVTAVAGDLSGGRADPLAASDAILVSHDGATYLIWNGKRTRVDTGDKAVGFTLGLDRDVVHPTEISTALFDAIPATEPLVVPQIPGFGTPSRWLPGSPVGRVLQTRDATGGVSGLYVLLADGVQQVSAFVADLLRASDSRVSAPQTVSPDRLIQIPRVNSLAIDYYPDGRLRFVDTEANPVTCVSWTKLATDRQASISLLSGRGLPTPQRLDPFLVDLVRDNRGANSVEADRTLVLPGAATLVASTSGVITSDTRESLYLVSSQGVRFGVAGDPKTLQALGIDPARAVQAPWPMLRTFAPGPEVNHATALVARDAYPAIGPMVGSPESERG